MKICHNLKLKKLTMKKLIIFYINVIFFMMIGVVYADIVSKDPNYLKRGKIDKVHIANYLKKELRKHNYTIILSLIHI